MSYVKFELWLGIWPKTKQQKLKNLARVVLAEAYNIAKCLPRLEN